MSKNFICFPVQQKDLRQKALKRREGKNLLLSQDPSGVKIQVNSRVSERFPAEFPAGKTVRCIDWDKKHSVLCVNYQSVWPEFQAMCYGATVRIIRGKSILTLPNVLPDTVIYSMNSQLLIGQVEKSPFEIPCAALLPLDQVQSGKDLESLYVFPSEPIIVESFAATAGAGRIHKAENIPGTGCCYGDVPNVYAWISPDSKKHGWAFTPHCRWELDGKDRPEDWLNDRIIYYDPIWYENTDNEPYTVMLGKETAKFPSLPVNINGEITRYQIRDVVLKSMKRQG